MRKVELNIVALAESESQDGNFTLILEEDGASRRLSITIGASEAQSIALFLEKITPPRPLTHDLFKNTLDEAGVQIESVYIHSIIEDTFHAQLLGKKADGSPLLIDARSSDAIALAVRFACPIHTASVLMAAVGTEVVLPDALKTTSPRPLKEQSLTELKSLLGRSLEEEDYEKAAELRDLIKDLK